MGGGMLIWVAICWPSRPRLVFGPRRLIWRFGFGCCPLSTELGAMPDVMVFSSPFWACHACASGEARYDSHW